MESSPNWIIVFLIYFLAKILIKIMYINFPKPSVDPLKMFHGPLGVQGTPFGKHCNECSKPDGYFCSLLRTVHVSILLTNAQTPSWHTSDQTYDPNAPMLP